ncbi:hypothetical protein RHGRI_004952 [Rhododendron griersonianum]|uniref:Pentatricopeptide repeat-containing protein n=1 Tax=Rhododendron griersonianum TaxID=479676 RepID=A0AAV6LAH9_9ERIC|nr:hypothetical protein RHGRI_004952 [Rhododendron griersonianum]
MEHNYWCIRLHGYGEESLQLFHEMQERGEEPDSITFLAVLSACNHCGLVEEGKKLFDKAVRDHKTPPSIEHYACHIDLLRRAGEVEDACEVVTTMPMRPSMKIWSSLVSACKLHGKLEIAETLAHRLVELELENAANYTLLSMVYAESGRFLIATEKSSKIEGKVQLIVEGKRYMVSVEEEEFFRIVSSSKQGSSPGSEVSKPREEDDDVDSSSDDKEANGTKRNVSEKDNSAIERNEGVKGDLLINTKAHAVSLENTACHVKKDNQVLVAQGPEDQQTKVQKPAEISNQEGVEESSKKEKSHSTQDLDSVVQDSVDPGIASEEERISLLNKDHQSEAQVIKSAEVIRQQQEIETNALAVNSPVEIDSNVPVMYSWDEDDIKIPKTLSTLIRRAKSISQSVAFSELRQSC